MCIVEQKTYYQADGSPRLFESIRRCENAIGSGTCSDVNHTFADIVETRPEASSRIASSSRVESSSRADVIVTDSRGQTRVYRDLSRRSSQRTKTGRSKREEDRSSHEYRRAAPSPVFNTGRASPVSRTATPSSAPPRMSSFPSESAGRITPGGTAIYNVPTSNVPRVPVVERRPSPHTSRRVSFINPSNDTEPPTRSHHPNLSINTNNQRTTPTSPTRASPGLSQVHNLRPTPRHARKDSARDLPPRSSSLSNDENDKEYSSREFARSDARRQRAEEASQRRRQEDLQAAEDRQLDLEAEQHRSRLSEISRPARASFDGEPTSWSRHTSPPRRSYILEEVDREANSPRYASASPMAHRPSQRRPSYGRPSLHQDPINPSSSPPTAPTPTPRPHDTIRSRGLEVVEERRRARASPGGVSEEPRVRTYERERQYESVFEDLPSSGDRAGARAGGRVEGFYVSEGPARAARRRREGEREGRWREFWA